jgi:hypothetical protein
MRTFAVEIVYTKPYKIILPDNLVLYDVAWTSLYDHDNGIIDYYVFDVLDEDALVLSLCGLKEINSVILKDECGSLDKSLLENSKLNIVNYFVYPIGRKI